jgi:hypothetical protein
MLKRLVVLSMAGALMLAGSGPAAGLELLASGDLSPNADLGACASVSFPSRQSAIVGELSVAGWVATPAQGKMMARPAFADAQPILVTNGQSWSGCVRGNGAPLRYGSALLTLSASGAQGGDVFIVTKCVAVNFQVSCSAI